MINFLKRGIVLLVSASLIVQPSAAFAQSNSESSLTLLQRLGCVLGITDCLAIKEISPPDKQKVLGQLAKVLSTEPSFATLLNGVRLNYDVIAKQPDKEALDARRPEFERKFKAEEKDTELVSMSDTTKNVVVSCLKDAKTLSEITSTNTLTSSDVEGKDILDTKACQDALLKREKDIAKQIREKDKKIQKIDQEIQEKEKRLRETTDKKERERLVKEIKEKEEERALETKALNDLERERIKLQRTRMLIAMAMVLAGLATGGALGLVLISQGLNMMSPSGNDGSDRRSDHPSSSEVKAEKDSSERSKQGAPPKPSDRGSDENIPARSEDDNEPDPEVVDSYSADNGFDVVNVTETRNSNGGYFLVLNQTTREYILKSSKDPKFKRVISKGTVRPFLENGSLKVPTPFNIARFDSLSIRKNGNVTLGIKLKKLGKTMFLRQNPIQRKPGWYLADVNN
jgi:hypothetical protein